MNGVLSTRRELLGGLASAGLTTFVRSAWAADGLRRGTRIDVHHHFVAPGLARKIQDFVWAKPILGWTPARSLEAMEMAGIETAVLSGMTGYAATPEDKRETAYRARANNDYGAQLVASHNGRFRFFATLPLPYIDESLKELEHSLDALGADGVFLWTNYGNRWIGDPTFERVFDEINRRKALVLMHPIDAPCCLNLQPDTAPQKVEWNTQTSRAIWSVLNSGVAGRSHASTATRYPDVTFIWPHAGGSLLGLVGRFVGSELMAEAEGNKPQKDSPLYHLRRFYYDTAASYNAVQMPALKALVGVSQIVFGSDAPFNDPYTVATGIADCGLSADEHHAIERENALKLLSRST